VQMKALVRKVTRPLGIDVIKYRTAPQDVLPEDVALIDFVRPYTLTTPERIYAVAQATRYLVKADIAGAFVECGVWRGGSTMAAAKTLVDLGAADRELYLFDTFEGMTKPTDVDLDVQGLKAAEEFERTKTGEDSSTWVQVPLAEVKANVAKTGYDSSLVHYVKGKVEDTLPDNAPDKIAFLRLDTDWYQSTKHEMETLWPRLVPGGVLIVDDYGHWKGSRQAVDEYIAEKDLAILLNRIDYTGRLAIKP
jgi:O-methyltransferase